MSHRPRYHMNGGSDHQNSFHRSSRYNYDHEPAGESRLIPRILDVYGGHRDITVCGHVDVIHLIPFRQMVHKQLIETYRNIPGNYEGQFENLGEKAKVIDFGNGYVSIHVYDDITRPELGEFLLSKGWRMLGFSSTRENGKSSIYEKWSNVHVRGES